MSLVCMKSLVGGDGWAGDGDADADGDAVAVVALVVVVVVVVVVVAVAVVVELCSAALSSNDDNLSTPNVEYNLR